MAIEKEIILKVNSDEAVQGIESVDDALKDTTETQEDLSTATLASAKSFSFMGVSINSVSKALKILKVSLIATGIGAIVVAVGTLAAAFLSTQRGIDALNSVLTPLKAVLETIWGIVQNLGEGLFEMISGDVVKGWETMGGAIEDVGDKMDEAWQKGKRLHDLQIQIREGAIQQTKATALLNLQIAKQRFIAEDTTKSYKERKEALDLVLLSEESLVVIQEAQIQQRIKALKLEQSFNDTKSDEFAEVVALESQLIDIEARRFERSKEARNQLNSLNAQFTQDEDGNPVNPITGLSTPQLENIIEEQIDVQISSADALSAYVVGSNKKTQDDIVAYNKLSAAKRREIDEIEKQQLLNSAQDLLFAIEMAAGQGTAVAKAAGIANVLIDTYRAIIGTWAGYSNFGPYGTIAAVVQTAAIGVMAGAAIKNIVSVKKPTMAGGNDSVNGLSQPSAQSAPTSPSFNVVGTSDTNQLAETVNAQQPVKAYVVASDVTTQQSMDRNIVENASFG